MLRKQAMGIKNYILYITRLYNVIIGYHTNVIMPKDIKILFEKNKISLDKLEPEISVIKEDFPKNDLIYKNLDMKLYSNWLLEYLFGIILAMYKDKKHPNIHTTLAKYFMNHIIENEKLMSKAKSIYEKSINTKKIVDRSLYSSSDEGMSSAVESAEESDVEDTPYKNEIGSYDAVYDIEDAESIWDID